MAGLFLFKKNKKTLKKRLDYIPYGIYNIDIVRKRKNEKIIMTDVQLVETFIGNWKQVDNTIDKFHRESAWDNMTKEQSNFINQFRIKQSEIEDTFDFYSRQEEIKVSKINNWLVEIKNYNEFYNDNIKNLTNITEA